MPRSDRLTVLVGLLLLGMLVGATLRNGLPMNRSTFVGIVVGETWPVTGLVYATVLNRNALARWVKSRA